MRSAEIIVAVSVGVAILIVAVAVAKHIDTADCVELTTSYGSVKSKHYPQITA